MAFDSVASTLLLDAGVDGVQLEIRLRQTVAFHRRDNSMNPFSATGSRRVKTLDTTQVTPTPLPSSSFVTATDVAILLPKNQQQQQQQQNSANIAHVPLLRPNCQVVLALQASFFFSAWFVVTSHRLKTATTSVIDIQYVTVGPTHHPHAAPDQRVSWRSPHI